MPVVPATAVTEAAATTTAPKVVKPKATKPKAEPKTEVKTEAVTVPKKAGKVAKAEADHKAAAPKAAALKAKAAKVEDKPVKVTVRMRGLKALLAGEMTASEVQAAIELSHSLKITLDKEVEAGTLTIVPPKGDITVAKYKLTAAGKKIAEKL